MATRNPLSTISYNSEKFLCETLNRLFNAHIIQSWQFIKHKGEEGDKDHIHLRVVPNKSLDPMSLRDEFKEYVSSSPKPLWILDWRNAKEEDWLLYAVHNEDYLAKKYPWENHKIVYDLQDIKCNEGYMLEESYLRALASLRHSSSSIAHSISNGDRPIDLIKKGENPMLVNSIARAFYNSDYTNLQQQYTKLKFDYSRVTEKLENLLALLKDNSMRVWIDDTGNLMLCYDDFENSEQITLDKIMGTVAQNLATRPMEED